MQLRTLLTLVVLAAIGVFTALNWSVLTARTSLSLGIATVEAPLGAVMLVFVALLTALFLVYVVYLQTSALLHGRRHARELQAQRELAEQAEASRVSELRTFVEAELKRLAARGEDSKSELLARLDRLEGALHSSIEHSSNSVAAYIGELEDRLERAASGTAARGPS